MTSTQTTPRALSIVGPGRVGRSLTQAASEAGIDVELLDRVALRAGPIGRERTVLLAVPDGEIASACEAVLAVGGSPRAIGHLSGATGLSALTAARRAGIPVFSLHPLQTFADGWTTPAGVPCAITADDEACLASVRALATCLGMRPFELADEDRAVYHAAASIASNFLVCLEQEAAELLGEIGIADGRRLLGPLVERTLRNWSERGAEALTGPIARGDEATVARHLEALEERAPDLVPLYRVLAERTRALARAAEPALAEAAKA